MLLYAITQRSLFMGDENAQAQALRAQARRLAKDGVHYLQIREKDLPLAALRSLTTSIVASVRSESCQMKILLNGPAAMAAETGCDGVHLTAAAASNDAFTARQLFPQNRRPCLISAACHSIHEVRERRKFADLLLFAPVFEKVTPHGVIPGVGLNALAEAVEAAQHVPVLALGGVTARNARQCIQAGAAGIAAIRLFKREGWKPLLHG